MQRSSRLYITDNGIKGGDPSLARRTSSHYSASRRLVRADAPLITPTNQGAARAHPAECFIARERTNISRVNVQKPPQTYLLFVIVTAPINKRRESYLLITVGSALLHLFFKLLDTDLWKWMRCGDDLSV